MGSCSQIYHQNSHRPKIQDGKVSPSSFVAQTTVHRADVAAAAAVADNDNDNDNDDDESSSLFFSSDFTKCT